MQVQNSQLALAHNDTAWLNVQTKQAQPLSDTVRADVDKLAQTEADEADAQSTAATSAYHSQQVSSILILVLGVLIALGLGYAVALGIGRATRNVQAVTTALATVDLTTTSGLTTRGELGRMVPPWTRPCWRCAR